MQSLSSNEISKGNDTVFFTNNNEPLFFKKDDEAYIFTRDDIKEIEFWDKYFNSKYTVSDKYITIQGLARQVYHKNFRDKRLYPYYKNKPSFNNKIERAYYGGFIKNEFKGYFKDPVFTYDVNSAYPNIMLEKIPVDIVRKQYKKMGMKELEYWNGVAYFDIELNEGLLPYRLQNEQVIYPVGRFKGYYFISEIRNLFNSDKIEAIYSITDVYRFMRTGTLFDDFILELYKLRQETGSNIIKKCLNAFYGSFSMKYKKINRIIKNKNNISYRLFDENKIKIKNKYFIYSDYIIEYEEIKSPFYNSISAFITSKQRQNMVNKMLDIKEAGGRVLKAHTDSITTDLQMSKDVFYLSNIIGDYKEEKYKSIYICSPSFYVGYQGAETVLKFSGVKNQVKKKYYDYMINNRIIEFNKREWNEDIEIGKIPKYYLT